MLKLEEFKSAKDMGIVFSKLFEARDFAHKAHLETKSYSQHKALNSFYDGLLDFTDSLVESYFGKHGVQKINIAQVKDAEPISYLEDFANFMEQAHKAIPETWVQNQVDEILALTYSTLYKLKNLK
jgi:methyltransferase-like protein